MNRVLLFILVFATWLCSGVILTLANQNRETQRIREMVRASLKQKTQNIEWTFKQNEDQILHAAIQVAQSARFSTSKTGQLSTISQHQLKNFSDTFNVSVAILDLNGEVTAKQGNAPLANIKNHVVVQKALAGLVSTAAFKADHSLYFLAAAPITNVEGVTSSIALIAHQLQENSCEKFRDEMQLDVLAISDPSTTFCHIPATSTLLDQFSLQAEVKTVPQPMINKNSQPWWVEEQNIGFLIQTQPLTGLMIGRFLTTGVDLRPAFVELAQRQRHDVFLLALMSAPAMIFVSLFLLFSGRKTNQPVEYLTEEQNEPSSFAAEKTFNPSAPLQPTHSSWSENFHIPHIIPEMNPLPSHTLDEHEPPQKLYSPVQSNTAQEKESEFDPDAYQIPQPLIHTESDPDRAHFQETYESFIRTRMQCREQVNDLTYEKFADKLRKSRDAILQKQNAQAVRFQVYIKEGKAALKAIAIK